MIELALTIVILGIATLISVPRMGAMIDHSRVNRTTGIIAADLEAAFVLAGRQRKPVRLTCACDSLRYRAIDRTGGAVRLSRDLAEKEFGVGSLVFSANPIDVFPSGVASSPLTVTIGAGGYTRQVTMTTAGQVRVVAP